MTPALTPADRVAILDAVARLAHAVDGLDLALLTEALTADGVFSIGGEAPAEAQGPDAVLALCTSLLPDGGQARRHVRNTIIDPLEAGEARARSYYLLTVVLDGGSPQVVATGIYDDHFVRDGTGDGERRWKIARRTAAPDSTAAARPTA